ncbi:WecB/TagA/CpsF family glycosyltransferase [Phormidium sp. LEGE 05292]|nr:WecB/TagA/CpsF family glycosyltransferase [Phormidium sp. LEGE 05292]
MINDRVNQSALTEEKTLNSWETIKVDKRSILGTKVNALSVEDATQKAIEYAQAGKSSYICLANVHMIMEAYDSREFWQTLNTADMVVPDGMPLVWGLRSLGAIDQTRITGRDITLSLCKEAAKKGIPVGFYGSSKHTLKLIVTNIKKLYPDLKVAYSYSPPFRPLSAQEDEAVVKEIQESGIGILFVGLGCPKQEYWMAQHKQRIPAVMLGVGAAFDFIAGTKPLAPKLMQETGLEWIFRLCLEPRRLWKRNQRHNPRFVLLFFLQLLFFVHLFDRLSNFNDHQIHSIYPQLVLINNVNV